jgi:hypothetical protein
MTNGDSAARVSRRISPSWRPKPQTVQGTAIWVRQVAGR